ncbi:hypothetical protein N9129_01690 [Akkermansiaceae bacterium]|nr:hypothetical protein [Akkermansiaceae bacterium]
MLVLTLPSIAILDDDGDGMSDIWEEKYRASSLLPNADTDGDGQSNLDESRAGTDPYNSNSSTGFVLVLEFPKQLNINWPVQPDHFYHLEAGMMREESDWQIQVPAMKPLGTSYVLPIDPDTAPTKFYRFTRLDQLEQVSHLHSESGKNLGPSFARALLTTSDSNEYFDPESIRISKGFVTVSLQTKKGKKYSISRGFPDPELDREILISDLSGTGKAESYSLPGIGGIILGDLQVEVSDIDSDGDQLSDWEELVVGTDPRNFRSDPDRDGDLNQVRQALTDNSFVSVESREAVANITRDSKGVFSIGRSGGVREVWVNYIITGSAQSGIDFKPPPGTTEFNGVLFGVAVIPFGKSSVEIEIEPLEGEEIVMSSAVMLTITEHPGYELEEGGNQVATVNVVREVALNVKNFGAIGDGIQDDTAAIQLALDALEESQSHNTLHFPVGTYRLDTPKYDKYTVTSESHILTFGESDLEGIDLEGRDLFFTGEPGSRLYSTVSPIRAHMLVVLATFRSWTSFGMTWQKNDELLSSSPTGKEPNGADGVSLVAFDTRVVEHVKFHDCKFLNCHGALMTTANGIDRRGHLRHLGFYDCEFLNPFGSNTKDGGIAWGGGQQTYLSQWVGLAVYDNNLFEGGGEDMRDSPYSEGGRLKDAAVIGGPVQLVFRGNEVKRMGIEAVFLNGKANFMNQTIESVAIPKPDGSEVARVLLDSNNTPSTFTLGSQIIIRNPTTNTQTGVDNVFEVVEFDQEENSVSFINLGYSGNSSEGLIIPRRADIYLSEPSARPLSIISGNLLDGEFPIGSDSQSYSIALTLNSRALVENNRITGWKVGVLSYIDGQPYHRATGLIVRDNLITLRDTSNLVEDAYHVGVRSWAASQLIENNTIIVPNSRRTFGISVYGKGAYISNNFVYVEESEDHPYTSYFRSVGISFGNQSSLTTISGNVTSGFNVGVGPASPSQSISHIVRDHISDEDTLPIDPRGLVDQFD